MPSRRLRRLDAPLVLHTSLECLVHVYLPLPPPVDPPQISMQPSDQLEEVPDSTVTFMIAATTAAGTLSYQWQRNGVGIAAASGVSGINSATLTITNVQEVNEGSYSCVVTNPAGSTTSTTAQLTICKYMCLHRL